MDRHRRPILLPQILKRCVITHILENARSISSSPVMSVLNQRLHRGKSSIIKKAREEKEDYVEPLEKEAVVELEGLIE